MAKQQNRQSTLWEQKELHKNPTVCCIGRELKPGTIREYIHHNYIRTGNLSMSPWPLWAFGLRHGI